MRQIKRKSPFIDCNGNDIYEGDTVKGVGKHVGRSEVFYDAGVWQPFSFLNNYDGNNYEIVSKPIINKLNNQSHNINV